MSSQDQEFEEQDQDQDEGEKLRTSGAQRQRSGGCWIIVLIVGLVVAALLYSGARIGSGGLKGGSGGGFDAGAKAYALAQETEAFRRTTRSNANYCDFTVVLEDAQGNLATLPGVVYEGYGKENNKNHCEQKSLRAKITAIHTIQPVEALQLLAAGMGCKKGLDSRTPREYIHQFVWSKPLDHWPGLFHALTASAIRALLQIYSPQEAF